MDMQTSQTAAADRNLGGKRILVVEDECFVAAELSDSFRGFGAEVIGPVASISSALDLMADHDVDLAILDIRLGNELCFGLAEFLEAKGIPFVFATGYGQAIVPPRFADVPLLTKPIRPADIAQKLEGEQQRLRERAELQAAGKVAEFRYSLTEGSRGCNWEVTAPSGALIAAGVSSSSLSARVEALGFVLKQWRRS